MKIAIPVNDKSENTEICISFGRTPYFLIYDNETQKSEYLDNGAAASQGGAGIKAAQMLADCGVKILITPSCGENAIGVLDAAEIGVYKSGSVSVSENIKAFDEGRLNKLSDIHAGFHRHGQ